MKYFLLPILFLALPVSANQDIEVYTDADYHEIQLNATLDHYLSSMKVHYEWDECVMGNAIPCEEYKQVTVRVRVY